MMPFMLTVFFTALLVVRLYDKFSPRQIARGAYALVTAGTLWLAFVASNNWSVLPVILGLITVGIGQGRWSPCSSTCSSRSRPASWPATSGPFAV